MTFKRRKINHIEIIQGAKRLRGDPLGIKEEEKVANHFEKLYSEKMVLDLVNFDCQFRKLNKNFANFLERPFKEDEVWETIQGCYGNKSLGLNRYNLNFFKNQWNVVKFMREFYKHEQPRCKVNALFIDLIPKILNPNNLSEKLISLVGNLYNIVAKTWANRLRNVIDEVIGKNRFASIKGRQLMVMHLQPTKRWIG